MSSPFHSLALRRAAINRDRGASHDATPPTPPGIRVRTTAVRRIQGTRFTPVNAMAGAISPLNPWQSLSVGRDILCRTPHRTRHPDQLECSGYPVAPITMGVG